MDETNDLGDIIRPKAQSTFKRQLARQGLTPDSGIKVFVKVVLVSIQSSIIMGFVPI